MLGRSGHAGIDPVLVSLTHEVATSLAAAVDGVVRPALCHRDAGSDNVLVDQERALVALLDFDVAEVWDPLVEQIKLEWFVFEANPAAREPFFDGYLAGDPMPPMFDERVRLASIVEVLLNHAANWHVQGQHGIAAEALDRLRVQLGMPRRALERRHARGPADRPAREWRTFGGSLDAVEADLSPWDHRGESESDEQYLLSAEGDNVKIRDELLDIKVLREVDQRGLERWEPTLKAAFPLDVSTLVIVFEALHQPLPELSRHAYAQDQLLSRARRADGRDPDHPRAQAARQVHAR